MITNFSATHSLVGAWVAEIRDAALQTDSMRFRRNMERIGEVAAYEISKTLAYTSVTVQTPMGIAPAATLSAQPVIATILRAGLPLYQGVLNFYDKADSAFIGSYRKHNADGSFVIDQQYTASPALAGRPLILADPMLATGASVLEALKALTAHDMPAQLHIVAAIACHTGINLIKSHFPDAYIWAGAIDPELTARGYIVPGLGDAGDLAFGKKRQF